MANNFICFHLIIYLFIITFIECAHRPIVPKPNYEVEYLSVIFRHGDRTPVDLYPNDPNAHENFEPVGLGQLTLNGKLREYELGNKLRHLYKDFLGEIYKPYMVKARSTDYSRTKMSLMLVLSALYPPRGTQIWNRKLNWQPIPFSYVPETEDIVMAPDRYSTKYIHELERVQELKEVKAEVENFHPLMKNLTRWSGKNISSIYVCSHLYHTFMAERSMGLEVPEWAHNIFPHGRSLWNATVLQYKIMNYNTNLRKFFGGMLVKNIIDTMDAIANKTIRDGRKIQLFSGHETNIASVLSTLGIYKPHVPEYSSAVIIELLRNRKGKYYVAIRYYLGIPSEAKILRIPGCDMNPCPLEKFIQLMKDVTPTDEEMRVVGDKNHN